VTATGNAVHGKHRQDAGLDGENERLQKKAGKQPVINRPRAGSPRGKKS